jgi:hypothetical protein
MGGARKQSAVQSDEQNAIAPTGRAMPPETELVDMRFADPIKRTNGEMWRQYRVI